MTTKRMILVLLIGIIATATSASAQTELAAATLGTQLAIALESPTNAVRGETLRRIVEVATYSPEFDLTNTVPSLVDVYVNAPDDRHRIMATVALHKIGNREGMTAIRDHLTGQRDRRVQIVSFAAVIDYFGAETFRGDEEAGEMARNLLAVR